MKHNIRTLQVFECVYRHGSVTKAADELGVTPSAVSHQLTSLHEQIGELLFERVGRGLVFTKRGQQIAESVRFALSEISSSLEEQKVTSLQTLRVTMCSCLGMGWFIPRINVSKDKVWLPNIRLQMHTGELGAADQSADVFFTTAPMPTGFWSHKLFDEYLVALAAAKGPIEALITHDIEEANYAADWQRFLAMPDHGISTLGERRLVGSSHYIFGLEMALKGVGAVLVPDFLAENCIIEGKAVQLSPLKLPTGRSYYINAKGVRRREPQIEAFCRWIRSVAYAARR